MDTLLHRAGHPAAIRMMLLNKTDELRSQEPAALLFRPGRPGYPAERVALAMAHEARFHLVIVDEHMRWFRHLHPELLPDGAYRVAVDFPHGGSYTLFAGYRPESHPAVTDKLSIQVKGAGPAEAEEPGQRLTASIDGLTAGIVAERPFRSGSASYIPVNIIKDGTLLRGRDLAPYLGAVAHIILISKAGKEFLHIHPMADAQHSIMAHTVFPRPGIYRMWVQFKTGQDLHTADFTLDVQADKVAGHDRAGRHRH